MKQFVIAGTLAGALALTGPAMAQTATQPQTTPATGTSSAKPMSQTGDQTMAPKAKAAKKSANADAAGGANGHTAPKDQPNTAETAAANDTAMALGSVRLPKAVKADGKDLPAGTYQVRLTADEAKPDAVGSSQVLERWVEFVQKGQVKGREVVSIVPATETKVVQKDAPPAPGGAKVQMLKGGDYWRVWINKGGNYYLVHLVP